MKSMSKAIGETIKDIRTERKLSQEVLSGLAGIGRSHLAMIETGRKAANIETLWKINKALNMKMSAFFEIVEEGLSKAL